jgi:hypothetical protein
MNQFLEELQLLISSAPESAVNTPATTSAAFKTALFNSFMPPIPRPDKLKSAEIGAGNEYGQKSRSGYWLPMDIPIGGWLNTEFAAIVAARAFGGTITDVPVTAGASFDHFVALQTRAQGRVPKLSTILALLGGYDFLHASCAVAAFEISFGGNTPPQYSTTFRNTGYSWKRLRDIVPAIVPPPAPTHHYIHPAAIKATFNDGSLRDFAADARLIGGRCGISQEVEVQALPGDPFRVSGDRSSGAYARVIQRGKRSYSPSIKVFMDENLAEFVASRDNTDITGLSFLFTGDPIGATPESYEIELTYPLATLIVEGDTENKNAALNISFDIDRADASPSIASLRVRNNQPALA